jgi:hypothetical protein
VLDTVSNQLTALTAEGERARLVSNDSRLLPVATRTDRFLRDLVTGRAIHVAGVHPHDEPIGFSPDSTAVYVFEGDGSGGTIQRLDIASGTRTPVRSVRPAEPSGLLYVVHVVLARDGEHLSYQTGWENSQLFMLTFK